MKIKSPTPQTDEKTELDKTNKISKKPQKQAVKKTWTLEDIRKQYRGIDLLSTAACSVLRRKDKSRHGITARTRLTAEEIIETVKELRERLDGQEEMMRVELKESRDSLDRIIRMFS